MTEREPHVPDDRDAHSYGRLYGVYSRLHDWFGRENRAFVSQDGTEVSGFDLQLRGDSGRFGFTRIVADAPAMAPVATASSIVPQPGEWYHLAGVYNSVKQTISLYVNGKHQQTVPFTQPWPARGSLAVGRGRFNGNAVDYVSGRIDDARTYVGALSASEISRLAGRARFQSTHPKPDRRSTRPSSGRSSRRSTHSGDGGLYGELIRNRDLKEDPQSPVAWSAVAAKGATASIALGGSQPLNSANPISLKLSIGKLRTGSRAGIASAGYWGIPVRPSTTDRQPRKRLPDRPDAEARGAAPGVLPRSRRQLLEGLTIPTRFEWSNTIGPIQDRPGHYNSAWGYCSQDGIGLLEYLEMAEELDTTTRGPDCSGAQRPSKLSSPTVVIFGHSAGGWVVAGYPGAYHDVAGMVQAEITAATPLAPGQGGGFTATTRRTAGATSHR